MQQDRTGFIGGSDIAAILGISKWQTPYGLYLTKIGEAPKLSADQELFFDRRRLAEPYVLSVLERITGIKPTNINRRFIDKEYPFFACEVDFEYFDAELNSEENGEIKTVSAMSSSDEWGDEFSNDVPLEYLCQAMWNLGITGRQKCHFAVMKHWDDFSQYIIYRNEELIGILREKALEFWQRVQDKNPPPPQKVSDYKIRKPNGKSAEANAEIISLITRIKDLKSKVKQLESLEDDLKMLIGDNSSIHGDSGPLLTWNEQEQEKFDSKALQAENPELYKRFLKKNKFRVLRLK